MRTAVVHDWLTGMRGGEHVLEALLPLVPEPTIFTLFHSPGSVYEAIESRPIRTSLLDRLPFAQSHYRSLLPFFPAAVERFDLTGFDFVVSSSHCVAKGALAPPGVPHLCYCHTPVRYAYEQFDAYFPRDRTRFYAVKRRLVGRLREWDRKTSGRPTRYLANSSAVAQRIRRHYGREAEVCHPPVDVEFFSPSAEPRRDFLLAVGALVPYNRFELAIDAAELVGKPLVVVGRGPEEKRLRDRAGSSVRWAGEVSREELRQLYRTCLFFLQPGEEDFGIAAAEAVASGAPVAALSRGGVLDIVRDGAEGVLYDEESAAGLAEALRRGERLRFDPEEMRRSTERFSVPRFRDRFRRAVEELKTSQSLRR
jgi:glycosyltransferase involved in cell wall biosynthesis